MFNTNYLQPNFPRQFVGMVSRICILWVSGMETPAHTWGAKMGAKPTRRAKSARLSKVGKWRHFPKNNHLLQQIDTGMYYWRVKVRGKLIRRKLNSEGVIKSG